MKINFDIFVKSAGHKPGAALCQTRRSVAWFTRTKPSVGAPPQEGERRLRTEGLWQKCEHCGEIIWRKALEDNLQVCPKCAWHFRIDARARLNSLLDDGVYEELDADLVSTDPLGFVDSKPYVQRLAGMQQSTGLRDALISVSGKLNGRKVYLCVLELKFIGGSMGAVMGEMITRAIERSRENRMPLDEARVPFISVLTDPTTGGVTASFAMLGDLNIAEPGAQIGFAGPRVIEQTIRQKLPEGFQTAEFVLSHGFLDAVVKRAELKAFIGRSLDFFAG